MKQNRKTILYCIIYLFFGTVRLLFYGGISFDRMINERTFPDAGTCLHILLIVLLAAMPVVTYLNYRRKQSAGLLLLFGLIVCNPEMITFSSDPVKAVTLILLFVYLNLKAFDEKFGGIIPTAVFLAVCVFLVPGNIFGIAPLIAAVYYLTDIRRINIVSAAVFALCSGAAVAGTRLLMKADIPYWLRSAWEFYFSNGLRFRIPNIIRYLLLIAIAVCLIRSFILAFKEYKSLGAPEDNRKKYQAALIKQKQLPYRNKCIVLSVMIAGFFISAFGELFTLCGSTAVLFILVSLLILSRSGDYRIDKALIKIDGYFENHLIIWAAILYLAAHMHDYFGSGHSFYSTVTEFFF